MSREHITCDIHLVLIKNNKLLMVQRSLNSKYMPGFYHLPAGHKEQDDSCLFTLLKETKEETGIDLNKNDIKLVHTMYHKSTSERIGLFFEATEYIGEVQNMEPDKHEKVEWIDIDNLPKNIVPYAKSALNMIAKGVPFSEYETV